jgi:hypothetical protein
MPWIFIAKGSFVDFEGGVLADVGATFEDFRLADLDEVFADFNEAFMAVAPVPEILTATN